MKNIYQIEVIKCKLISHQVISHQSLSVNQVIKCKRKIMTRNYDCPSTESFLKSRTVQQISDLRIYNDHKRKKSSDQSTRKKIPI